VRFYWFEHIWYLSFSWVKLKVFLLCLYRKHSGSTVTLRATRVVIAPINERRADGIKPRVQRKGWWGMFRGYYFSHCGKRYLFFERPISGSIHYFMVDSSHRNHTHAVSKNVFACLTGRDRNFYNLVCYKLRVAHVKDDKIT